MWAKLETYKVGLGMDGENSNQQWKDECWHVHLEFFHESKDILLVFINTY